MFALILNGRVHQLFDAKPELHPAFKVVEVGPSVKVGMEQVDDGSFAFPKPPALDLSGSKRHLQDAINVKRTEAIEGGYKHNFGGSAGIRTLDNRTESDAINWLGLKGLVDAMIAQGQGADMVQLRDASDQTFFASAQTIAGALIAMAQWRSALMAHSWTLKDRVKSAADEKAIGAIDINAGWPV